MLIDSYQYYGRKDKRYFSKSYRLYPKRMNRHVDCCMGSGNQTANARRRMLQRVAIEKDKSIYLLNKSIQKNPYETADALRQIIFSKQEFEKAKDIVNEINAEEKKCQTEAESKFSPMEVAKAAYSTLVMGFNSQRGGYRYKMSRPNVQKILYKNVQLVCLS